MQVAGRTGPNGKPGAVPVAYPIDGWSNWVTFHDVCRECGRRVTGFVCDSGRLTRLPEDRWSVEMRWQHDGEGAIECELRPRRAGDMGPRRDRSGAPPLADPRHGGPPQLERARRGVKWSRSSCSRICLRSRPPP